MSKYDIGLIGLAVMGENLVLNMENHGFSVAVYNRTTSKVENFISCIWICEIHIIIHDAADISCLCPPDR